MDLSFLLSANSGPVWGLVGVLATQLAQTVMAHYKRGTDHTQIALTALNQGQQQLVEGLFQQIKTMQEQITTLQQHTADCERRHAESEKNFRELQRQLGLSMD